MSGFEMNNSIYIISCSSKSALAQIVEEYENHILHMFAENTQYPSSSRYCVVMKIEDPHTRNKIIEESLQRHWHFATKEGGQMDSGFKRKEEEQ